MDLCPCGSNGSYAECCGPLIRGEQAARTAVQLMRSRYSAYVRKETDYILASLHPDHRADYDDKSTRAWADRAEWHTFEVLRTVGGGAEDREGQVEFVATYTENGVKTEHHELSLFRKKGDAWYFVSGRNMPSKPVVNAAPKLGRNDPCSCGSGKKFKKCCGK